MRKLETKAYYVIFGLLLLGSQKILSQEIKTTLEQEPKFIELLNEKRKIGASIAMNDGYKIQIFNGTSSESRQKLAEFKKEFKDFDSTIFYSSPSYKVYVGPFETRIAAENALLKIKSKFPSSLLIKP